MAVFFSTLMSVLMVSLIGVILFKNIVGLIEVMKARKVAKQIREKAMKGEDITSLDN